MNKSSFNILFGIAVAVFVGAWFYSGTIKPRYATPGDAEPQAVLDRIRPFGQVAVAGDETAQSAPAVSAPAAIDPVQETVAETVPETVGAAVDQVRETAGAAVAQVSEAVATMAPAAAPATKLGQETYASACFACHTTGVAGSPKIGDVEAWAPRIAQGMDVLNEHAVKGYQGSAGVMPAKGGRMDLSDEAVIAAVAYMVQESGGN